MLFILVLILCLIQTEEVSKNCITDCNCQGNPGTRIWCTDYTLDLNEWELKSDVIHYTSE